MPATIKQKSKTGKTVKIRQIAYVPGQDTIFVDEMVKLDPKALDGMQKILITKGKIKIDNSEKTMIDFMEASPQNIENGGRAFKKLNIASEDEFEDLTVSKIIEASTLINQADDQQKKALAIQLLGLNYKFKSVVRCKLDLINACETRRLSREQAKNSSAKSFADIVIDWFANSIKNETIMVITKAIDNDIITFRNGSQVFILGKTAKDEDTLVFTAQSQSNMIREFAVFLKTDKEGLNTLKHIAERIKDL